MALPMPLPHRTLKSNGPPPSPGAAAKAAETATAHAMAKKALPNERPVGQYGAPAARPNERPVGQYGAPAARAPTFGKGEQKSGLEDVLDSVYDTVKGGVDAMLEPMFHRDVEDRGRKSQPTYDNRNRQPQPNYDNRNRQEARSLATAESMYRGLESPRLARATHVTGADSPVRVMSPGPAPRSQSPIAERPVHLSGGRQFAPNVPQQPLLSTPRSGQPGPVTYNGAGQKTMFGVPDKQWWQAPAHQRPTPVEATQQLSPRGLESPVMAPRPINAQQSVSRPSLGSPQMSARNIAPGPPFLQNGSQGSLQGNLQAAAPAMMPAPPTMLQHGSHSPRGSLQTPANALGSHSPRGSLQTQANTLGNHRSPLGSHGSPLGSHRSPLGGNVSPLRGSLQSSSPTPPSNVRMVPMGQPSSLRASSPLGVRVIRPGAREHDRSPSPQPAGAYGAAYLAPDEVHSLDRGLHANSQGLRHIHPAAPVFPNAARVPRSSNSSRSTSPQPSGRYSEGYFAANNVGRGGSPPPDGLFLGHSPAVARLNGSVTPVTSSRPGSLRMSVKPGRADVPRQDGFSPVAQFRSVSPGRGEVPVAQFTTVRPPGQQEPLRNVAAPAHVFQPQPRVVTPVGPQTFNGSSLAAVNGATNPQVSWGNLQAQAQANMNRAVVLRQMIDQSGERVVGDANTVASSRSATPTQATWPFQAKVKGDSIVSSRSSSRGRTPVRAQPAMAGHFSSVTGPSGGLTPRQAVNHSPSFDSFAGGSGGLQYPLWDQVSERVVPVPSYTPIQESGLSSVGSMRSFKIAEPVDALQPQFARFKSQESLPSSIRSGGRMSPLATSGRMSPRSTREFGGTSITAPSGSVTAPSFRGFDSGSVSAPALRGFDQEQLDLITEARDSTRSSDRREKAEGHQKSPGSSDSKKAEKLEKKESFLERASSATKLVTDGLMQALNLGKQVNKEEEDKKSPRASEKEERKSPRSSDRSRRAQQESHVDDIAELSSPYDLRGLVTDLHLESDSREPIPTLSRTASNKQARLSLPYHQDNSELETMQSSLNSPLGGRESPLWKTPRHQTWGHNSEEHEPHVMRRITDGGARQAPDEELEMRLSDCLRMVEQLEHERETHHDYDLPAGFRDAVMRLSQELEVVGNEAFEQSCSRAVPGAMEIFEQRNLALDRVATLLDFRGGHQASYAHQQQEYDAIWAQQQRAMEEFDQIWAQQQRAVQTQAMPQDMHLPTVPVLDALSHHHSQRELDEVRRHRKESDRGVPEGPRVWRQNYETATPPELDSPRDSLGREHRLYDAWTHPQEFRSHGETADLTPPRSPRDPPRSPGQILDDMDDYMAASRSSRLEKKRQSESKKPSRKSSIPGCGQGCFSGIKRGRRASR